MNKRNILITGAAGYIGSNLKKYLGKLGYNIFQIDKQYGSYVEDINDEYFEKHNIDYIVHLAAISGIKNCETDMNSATIDNVIGTILLMDKAKNHNIPMIFASSQAAKIPSSSYYATTKYIAETYAKNLNMEDLASINILRFANVYGGEDYVGIKTSVVSKIVSALRSDETFTVHGNGNQTRDFIHVDELIKCIELLISHEAYSEEPIDIGTGVERSILDVVKMIDGLKYEVNQDLDSAGAASNVADTCNIKELIKYTPKDLLEDYIESL